MKLLCLGGAGRIAREAVWQLAAGDTFSGIVVADLSPSAVAEVVAERPDRLTGMTLDVRDLAATTAACRGFDVVLDGTTLSLNGLTARAIAAAGCHGINLNGFGDELACSDTFARAGRVLLAGFGMTPGVTNLMAAFACAGLAAVDSVRISHGAFRPLAFSRAIAETTTYEYDPALPSRVVFEDGRFVQVPPFARPLEVELPPPFGRHVQYIIPHAETRTLAGYLRPKGVRLIEVRGTWPPANMALLRGLHAFGLLANPRVRRGGVEVGVLDAIVEHLCTSPAGTTTELYGYALHVEVTGARADGTRERHTLTHTHPPSDGSVPDWAGLRAYTRNVGLPLAVAADMIARGEFTGTGVRSPEATLDPAAVFARLRPLGLIVHHNVTELPG